MKPYLLLLFSATALLLINCSTKKAALMGAHVIQKSCDLNDLQNDTVIIEGIYASCMEYSSFQTIKNDECYADFSMELELSREHINDATRRKIFDMHGCNASRKMIVKGFLRKGKGRFGHLGSNNAELTVFEILWMDEIKYFEG